MGYELRRWLADRLPSGLSSGERLVALELADQANDQTRKAFGSDLLVIVARRCGLADANQVGKVVTKLSGKGVELRVPVRDAAGQVVTDKRGRVLFACKGHQMTYRIPTAGECPVLKVTPAGDLQSSPESEGASDGGEGHPQSSPAGVSFDGKAHPGGPQSSPAGAQSSPAEASKVTPAGDPSPQASPQVTSSLSSDPPATIEEEREDLNGETSPPAEPVHEPDRFTARLMAEHAASVDEVTAVLAAASRDGIRNLPAWSASTVGREDFARRVAELRAKPAPRQRPVCGHSDADDPENPGTCLLCKLRAGRREKRSAVPGPPAEPSSVAAEEDAAARAHLAGILARGRAERERKERQKTARDRKPAVLGEVLAFTPEAWARRETILATEDGARAIPYESPEPSAISSQETA